MSDGYQVTGTNSAAPFTLRIHRGDGMALLAMNWRNGRPPDDFVGFAIEYQEPGGSTFYPLNNRLSFPGAGPTGKKKSQPTTDSPIQKFHWVHFPRNADLAGPFVYRVTPRFMDAAGKLTGGPAQQAAIELRRETYPGQLNVAFTRGYVSSQAFVDKFASAGKFSTLIPATASKSLTFKPTHPKTDEALAWMGFETRSAVLEVLDQAIADATAEVRVVAYELNEPEVVSRLERLGARLWIIIDDSKDHGYSTSAESAAAKRLAKTAGADHVVRQHMASLQHNKTIVVEGAHMQRVVCGSTNLSWRGFYVQSNNAVVLQGASAVAPFRAAFDEYWANGPTAFGKSASAVWHQLGLAGIDAQVTFSPHGASNAVLKAVADDIAKHTTSSLFFSLAFLYQTPGALKTAIKKVSGNNKLYVCGISDRKVGGLHVTKPGGNVAPVYPAALTANVPAPFSKEPTGGSGIRMHHKFVVIDFDQPTARVYLGSYNFSSAADGKNGENLVLIRDRRVAVSYMVEAVRIFDAYHFRVAQADKKKAKQALELVAPPRRAGDEPWWKEDYTDPQKIRDREIFA